MIIYSKSSALAPGAIGQLETPIKMIIEHESDLLTQKGGVCDWLFNVEKSNKFGETIIGQNDFEIFQYTKEGEAAPEDVVVESYKKFIEHIQFMKEFVITAEMMEDAHYGIAGDAKRRIENFVRAYYKTINRICETALYSAYADVKNFAGTKLDLCTADDFPLFYKAHVWGSDYSLSGETGTQSNYFWGDVFGDEGPTTAAFEELLSDCAMRIRNMKDENGEPLGYTADTIILPSNRIALETAAKKVCGSYGALGNGYNDINLHAGNWNVIVLPNWIAGDDRFMVMSSEANKNLAGNMFFNRVPLTVTNWVDNHSGNYIWNGRCRFGVGFGTYKHILMAVNSKTEVNGASQF